MLKGPFVVQGDEHFPLPLVALGSRRRRGRLFFPRRLSPEFHLAELLQPQVVVQAEALGQVLDDQVQARRLGPAVDQFADGDFQVFALFFGRQLDFVVEKLDVFGLEVIDLLLQRGDLLFDDGRGRVQAFIQRHGLLPGRSDFCVRTSAHSFQ
ncbi:MAG: hypothetical protein MUF02_05495 [Acidobacteria bacterium]|nr:hypothetical protein [Acidobacteriota bacterium]